MLTFEPLSFRVPIMAAIPIRSSGVAGLSAQDFSAMVGLIATVLLVLAIAYLAEKRSDHDPHD